MSDLARVISTLRRTVQGLHAEFGNQLALDELLVLASICEQPGPTPEELASRLGLRPSRVHRILRHLSRSPWPWRKNFDLVNLQPEGSNPGFLRCWLTMRGALVTQTLYLRVSQEVD